MENLELTSIPLKIWSYLYPFIVITPRSALAQRRTHECACASPGYELLLSYFRGDVFEPEARTRTVRYKTYDSRIVVTVSACWTMADEPW